MRTVSTCATLYAHQCQNIPKRSFVLKGRPLGIGLEPEAFDKLPINTTETSAQESRITVDDYAGVWATLWAGWSCTTKGRKSRDEDVAMDCYRHRSPDSGALLQVGRARC
jgi:hypothetical protein